MPGIFSEVQKNTDKLLDLYFKNTQKITSVHKVTVTELGSAENNVNVLITLNGEIRFVVRVVRHENHKHRLTGEFETLQKLPKDISANPIALDLSKTIIPHSFMLETFIEGDQVTKWDIPTLKQLAVTMAKFHQIKHNRFTGYGGHGEPAEKMDITGFFYDVNREFLDDFPSLRQDPDVAFALQKIQPYLKSKQHLFDQITHFSLIHGDLTTQNILVNHDNLYILDWEVSTFGDNANDFATFFYDDFEYHNWRVWLDPHHQKVFIDEYLRHFDDETLKSRIEVWLIFDKVCSLIFCKKRLKNYGQKNAFKTLPEETFNFEITKLSKSIRAFFHNSGS